MVYGYPMSKSSNSPRDRILETATDLFANQGYRATGTNEVIDKSGVAKATFYNHFPTKDDLCLAYLQERNVMELDGIKAHVAKKRTPRSRFMGVIEFLEPWLKGNKLRGCGFLNMVAEIPEMSSPLRQEGKMHYTGLHDFIRELATKLLASDQKRYGSLNADTVADDYMVIIGGTIALVEIYNDTWPIRQGIDMVSRMIR
jgi:AcrR family transcriptional regulator